MEAILLAGVQASGKSTFYQQRFFRTHMRISLDMLRTRHREGIFLRTCIETGQRFVVDNTNATVAERARYISAARAANPPFAVIGYYFIPDVEGCLRRNNLRATPERVPIKGLLGTAKRLEPPTLAEGFDALHTVTLSPGGEFLVEEWHGPL